MVAPLAARQLRPRGLTYLDQLLAALGDPGAGVMNLARGTTIGAGVGNLGQVARALGEPVPVGEPPPALGGGGAPPGFIGPPVMPGGALPGGLAPGGPEQPYPPGFEIGGPPGLGGGLPPVGAPPAGAGLPPVGAPPGLPPTGGGGGFPDESARAGIRSGLGPTATGQPPPGPPGGLGTTGMFSGADLSPDIADAIYADPSSALRNAYLDAGMSPSNNPYVRMAMARLQPVVAALADFQGIINAGAGAAVTGDELKTVLPGLIAGLVSGKLNGRQILDQILGMADDDEIKTFLAEMGAPRLLELQGNLSGTSARRQQASARYQANRIADFSARQQAAAGRDEDVDEREWLKLMRGQTPTVSTPRR